MSSEIAELCLGSSHGMHIGICDPLVINWALATVYAAKVPLSYA